jgi:hypothetical protein
MEKHQQLNIFYKKINTGVAWRTGKFLYLLLKNNPISEIRCTSCGNYRRLETINSILNDPMNATQNDIKLLSQRRKKESKEFQEHIKVNQSEKFFALEIEWFLLWKCYVMNDMSEKYVSNTKKKISPNKYIGVLTPGPITNMNLFDKNAKEFNEKTLKKGLKKVSLFLIKKIE